MRRGILAVACLAAFAAAAPETASPSIALEWSQDGGRTFFSLGGVPATSQAVVPLPVSAGAAAALYRAPGNTVLFRALRDADRPELGYVIASIPGCSLIDANGQVHVTIQPDSPVSPTSLRSLQLRPHLPAAYVGCKADAVYSGLPADRRLTSVTVALAATVAEEAAAIPARVVGKGTMYLGQKEISEKAADLTSTAAAAGAAVDPAAKAALEAELAAEEARKADEAKPWWQRYWHLLLPLVLMLVFQNMGGGGGGGAQEEGQGQGQGDAGARGGGGGGGARAAGRR